ncbi:MFS transporter [Paeniglutamicibacter antarcticus]|uniref:MFS transporter n=1 Tax=Arthrobacter terrae TaxID=2935737 RepID=A0A931CWL6_9MICC|nr:MFS transporter [Arthrobacter terrae]
MVAGILLVALTLRTTVTVVPPLVSTINHDLPLDPSAVGVLGMLPTAAFAVFGFLTPYVIKWASLERLTIIAMLVAIVGQICRVLVPSTGLFLLFSVIALAGLGAGNVLLPPLVKQYFPDRIGLMTALYVTVLSAGTALPAELAVPVADAAGWQTSLALWAGVNMLAAVPWFVMLISSRRPGPLVPGTTAAGDAVGPAVVGPATAVPKTANTKTIKIRPWRSPLAIGLTLMFGCTSLNTYAMFAWLPSILTDAGLGRSDAGSMLALFAGVGLPMSLLVPLVASRLKNPFPMVLIFLACFIGGYLGLLLSPAAGTWLWVVLAGIGPGTFPLSLLLINHRTRTRTGAGALSGFSQGAGYALACTGPLFFGILHEGTGSWLVPFLFLFATLLLLVGGAFFACKPRYLEDEALLGA